MLTSRRGLITGLVSLVAAPAIVRVQSLMQLRARSSVVWAPLARPTPLVVDVEYEVVRHHDPTDDRRWVDVQVARYVMSDGQRLEMIMTEGLDHATIVGDQAM